MKNADAEMTLLERTMNLFAHQLPAWEQCRTAYANLSSIREKSILIHDMAMRVQWNPGRLISTTANVDAKSIQERPCFLCKDNRPIEQHILYAHNYSILVNPFPIFPIHFTITHNTHRAQALLPLFDDLLFFSKELGHKLAIFYNGPRCGASAPDHAHFQAGEKDFLPVTQQLELLKTKSKSKLFCNTASIRFVNDTIRKIILIEGNNPEHIKNAFELVYSSITKVYHSDEEPMMNVLSMYDETEQRYEIILYVREKHRPSCYFASNGEQIIFSPATIDASGLCTVPREEDFEKMNAQTIGRALKEVFVSEDTFASIENEVTFRL